jgi:hypothetical protein
MVEEKNRLKMYVKVDFLMGVYPDMLQTLHLLYHLSLSKCAQLSQIGQLG